MDQWKLKRLFNEATAEITRLRAELVALKTEFEAYKVNYEYNDVDLDQAVELEMTLRKRAEAELKAVRSLLRPALDFICAHGDREDEGDQGLANRISAALAPSPAGEKT